MSYGSHVRSNSVGGSTARSPPGKQDGFGGREAANEEMVGGDGNKQWILEGGTIAGDGKGWVDLTTLLVAPRPQKWSAQLFPTNSVLLILPDITSKSVQWALILWTISLWAVLASCACHHSSHKSPCVPFKQTFCGFCTPCTMYVGSTIKLSSPPNMPMRTVDLSSWDGLNKTL